METDHESLFTCKYCNNKYKSISSLNCHQKTAKFCIQLQNREVKVEEKYICEHCNKDFNLKHVYNNHTLVCKEKKAKEEINTQQNLEQLKEEIQKLKEENSKIIEKLKEENFKTIEENSSLKLIIKFKDEQIEKLEKINKELINKPTSTTINNNDNRKTQYNIQFNQLFEKLDILNESNVNKRINGLSEEHQIKSYKVDNFIKEFGERLIYALKDLTFCTDQSRKTVVIKDENSKSVKMTVEEMISKCLELGTEGIKNHFTIVEQDVDDRIENCDETLTSEMLDIFLEEIRILKKYTLENENGQKIDLKDANNPLRKLSIPFIKLIEQHYKSKT
jgi:hypothetical protein